MAITALYSKVAQGFQKNQNTASPWEESRNPVWIRRLAIISFLLQVEYEDFGVNDMPAIGVQGPDKKTLGNLPGSSSLE